jgi:hypothetical protein
MQTCWLGQTGRLAGTAAKISKREKQGSTSIFLSVWQASGLENTTGRWIGRTGIQDGSRDWDDGQARVEVELTKQTSTDSWNSQAGKVSGIVRARNTIGSTTYVIQILIYFSMITFAYFENLKSKVSFDVWFYYSKDVTSLNKKIYSLLGIERRQKKVSWNIES